MNLISRIFLVTAIITLPTAGILHSQSEGVKVGVVQVIDKKSGEIIVSSPTAGDDIKMGDLLYVLIDGKVVQLRSTFPMMTVSKCKPEGKNRALWAKAEKGMKVYRYKKGIEDSQAIVKDETATDTKNTSDKIVKRGPGGGFIFYDKGNSDGGWRYLEAAPEDQSSGIQWHNGDYIKTGVTDTAIGSGKSNTKKIIKAQGNSTYAAKICADYRGGGKSDWFLPSKDELGLIYANLYKNGVGGFADVNYWSSSEFSANGAWNQFFNNGYQGYNMKNYVDRVRAVRAFK
jgi:hypothetical protein